METFFTDSKTTSHTNTEAKISKAPRLYRNNLPDLYRKLTRKPCNVPRKNGWTLLSPISSACVNVVSVLDRTGYNEKSKEPKFIETLLNLAFKD